MDRRSWLWRRKSSEKSSGETESLGSVSSHSERCFDDQEAFKASPHNDSPDHAQSPEVSTNADGRELHETVKRLTDKLSAALLNSNAKEELVKQHAKVAEEAVSGWEKAELEVATLKRQLEASAQKNSALEDRISQLGGALKECVRELRQSREEQEQRVNEALIKKARQWESEKHKLESQLTQLQAQIEAAKAEAITSRDFDLLRSKLEAAKIENSALKVELHAEKENLQVRTLERDLSTRAAETASKQHLESIKKVAKLEAECRKLQSVARRIKPIHDNKPAVNSVCMESLTDSQSDNGERLLSVENEPHCSDPGASALISELDQFKNEKAVTKSLASSVDIDLMDDFLEMERFAALPEAGHSIARFDLDADLRQTGKNCSHSTAELEALHGLLSDVELKVEKLENEKANLEAILATTQNQLETSCNQLIVAESKLTELQKQFVLAKTSREVVVEAAEAEAADIKRKQLESQLESVQLELRELKQKIFMLEEDIAKERTLSANLGAKVDSLSTMKKSVESELELANFESGKLMEKVGTLQGEVEEEKTLSSKYKLELEAAETAKKALQHQIELANLEVANLHVKVALAQNEVEKERALSAEFAAKLETMEAEKVSLYFQLETAKLEVEKLNDKMSSLETQFKDERASSATLAAKCQILEDELSRRNQDADQNQRYVTRWTGEVKEKEVAAAAGKLAECQETIASLSRQLKLLATLDDMLLETEMPMLNANGGLVDLKSRGVEAWFSSDSSENIGGSTSHHPPSLISFSSPPTSLGGGFAKILSQTQSSSITESH